MVLVLTTVLRESERFSAVLLWDHTTVSGGGIPRKEQEICSSLPSGTSTRSIRSANTSGATTGGGEDVGEGRGGCGCGRGRGEGG